MMCVSSALRNYLYGVVCLLLAACSGSNDISFTEQVKQAAQEEARTGPGLWRVTDDDTTVYLFGTVHILRPETIWQVQPILDAFQSADAVYFEADVESLRAQGETSSAVTELGIYLDGGSLEETLDTVAEREVAQTATLLGLTLQDLNRFKPWFASFALSNEHLEQQGFERSSGVERVLGKEAVRLGLPLRYLETGAEQIRIIANTPEEEQIALLVQTANQIEEEPNFLDVLISEWAEGDDITLGQMIADDEAFGSGDIYEKVLKGRNSNWTEQIETLLDAEAGTFFIAVGAAHLAGEDSVQAMLTEGGRVVARVNPRKAAPEP